MELGSGTGASGLYAAGLGAKRVALSDGEAGLVPLLEANAQRNRGTALSFDVEIVAAAWRFGEPMPAELQTSEPYDLVLGSDVTYSVNAERDALCQTLHSLLESGAAKRCVIAHEHRRADMFDVDAIVRNEPASAWDENDNCLGTFLEAAEDAALRITPLVTEPGSRIQRPSDGVVEMTTDLTVFEVFLA